MNVPGRLMLAGGVIGALVLPIAAQQSPDLFKAVSFREIGPTRQGGRFVDFAVVETTPQVFFAASSTGGLYKTENNGLNFTPVFDNQPVASIGAVAVSQSSPNVVYLGTGEGNNSRSTYWGDGVYVSVDGGKTWIHAGLSDSHHIGRIVVHPTDPNTAYVAALGHLYSDNAERGLYKTVDGGKSWVKSLAVASDGRDIGAVDVAMDPKSPLVLYAAAYDKVRRPWSFAEGGPGSGLYKTVDAGKTWTKLAGGLPTGMLGRIGIAISRQDSNTVYTLVENANAPGVADDVRKRRLAQGFGDNSIGDQLYRSDDAGKTWRLMSPPPAPVAPATAGGQAGPPQTAGRGARSPFSDTPYYYSQVRVDPNNKEHVFVLSTGASQSQDGGKTWAGLGAGGDNHALWINPRDSKHMLLGYDHGLSVTFDGGQNWFHPDNVAAAQAYAVGFDMDTPYNVYTGLQDNGSHRGPSTKRGGGTIAFEDWTTVGGGDGQYNVVDWNDGRWLYNEYQFGTIQRVDQQTGESTSIEYHRPQGQDPVRYNWTAPILVSPHDSNVIYFGANVVLKSSFRGSSWQEISPDLTVNDLSKRAVSGPCETCGSGNVTYATITTLDESPIVPGLLWVGTDDGNVQVTKDGGKTWTNVRDRITGHPGYWVSRVEASHVNPATAYVSITGLRNDDFRPFLWKTTDFGQTWTSIAGNLPKEAINVIREDPRNPSLLFVGTDLGVYVTLDGGQAWSKLRGSPPASLGGGGRGGGGGGRGGGANQPARGLFPTVPVVDLKIHPRDHELIAATHGRGLIIADIAAYEELTPAVLSSDVHLFEIAPVIRSTGGERGAVASLNFAGPSRPGDMAVSYYLKADVAGDVKVRVYDGARLVAEMDGPKSAGINTVRWNLQARRERIPGEVAAGGGRRGGGGGGGGQGADPNFVYTEAKVGAYRVVLSAAGREFGQTAVITAEPMK
jgi:photosystem II stability/assembly factor-like uncharacterized protein